MMPTWFPPTPPRDDHYVDECCFLLYDNEKSMSLESLSNVQVKKKPKQSLKSGIESKNKVISRNEIKAPKSLFNRQFGLKKKEKLKQKISTGALVPPKLVSSGLSPVKSERVSTSSPPPTSTANSDWIVNEDWGLMQAIQQVLEIPLSLITTMPAHTVNWDMVADVVKSISSVYRSPKECRQRFDLIVSSLNESKVITPRKKLKTVSKYLVKSHSPKSQQMSAKFASDNNNQFSTLYSDRFEACRVICSKRIPPKTAAGTGQFQRNPKHTNILLEKCGINYDQPLHPMQVATARVQRLANQKKSSAEQHVTANAVQPTTPTNIVTSLPPGSIQHIGGTIITSGTSVKTTIPVNAPLPHLAAAIPLSGVHSNIVVHPTFARKHSGVQATMPKAQVGKVTGTHLAITNPDQPLAVQQPVHSVSLTFSAQSSIVTFATAPASITTAAVRSSIAYPARAPPTKLSTVQQIRQAKQTTPVKQQMKQINVTQQLQQAVPAVMSGPTTLIDSKKTSVSQQQFVLHQHMIKHRQLPQQQHQVSQVRQVVTSKSLQQKPVYSAVPTHHLLVCGASTAGKMTSQSTVQMLSEMMAQQRQQRRMPGKTAVVQTPVTLTVTKLLQSAGASSIRHTLLTQNPQITQQSSQQSVLPAASSNISIGGISTPQPIMTSQHRQFQMTQISQPHISLPSAVVASTSMLMHRSPVVAIGNSQVRLHTTSPVAASQITMTTASHLTVSISDQTTASVSVASSHSD